MFIEIKTTPNPETLQFLLKEKIIKDDLSLSINKGDDTARLHGRLTLNPIKHLDPFGSVILPLLILSTIFAKILPSSLVHVRTENQPNVF